MNKQYQWDRKRKSTAQKFDDDDDEQIKRTLNFFDSILDQYLSDEDLLEEKEITIFSPPVKPTNDTAVRQIQHEFHDTRFNQANTSSSFLLVRDQPHIPAPYSHQPDNVGHRYEQRLSIEPTDHVRRYTSENNLNQIPSSSKPRIVQKISPPRLVQTTATSTKDISTTPLWKSFSSQAHRSALIDKTNHLALNGISASLIDLSSIDKVSSGPRFRFVPPSNPNLTLEEETEIEPPSNSKPDRFHLKTIPSDQTSFNNQNKYFHKIVKPTVIIPVAPKFVPVTRFTETNIHHQNDYSAFKPHSSSRSRFSSRVQGAPPVSNIIPTESTPQSNVNIGITNTSSQLCNSDFVFRQQQKVPQFPQPIATFSSIGTPETVNKNMFASRSSYQPKYTNTPPYTPQSYKLNGHHQYHSPRPVMFENSISRCIQQVNNSSSSISGLVHPAYSQPFTNGERKAYPYGSHIPTSSSISPPTNGSDHLRRQNPYLNPSSIHKYHSSQHPIPTQPVLFAAPSLSSNIYHFNQNNSPRDGQSKRNSNRRNTTITTYL